MKTMKTMFCAVACLGTAWVALGATTGSYYGNAPSISAGSTKSITLTAAYDPEDKSYDDSSGVYYLKFTATRGNAYTVYTSGTYEEISMSVDDVSTYYDKEVSCPWFNVDTDPDGVNQRGIITEDDWSEDDTKSVTYYICIEGDVGWSFSVHLVNGVVQPTEPSGTETKPLAIASPGTEISLASGRFMFGAFYYSVTLDKTKRYKFGTTGGSEDDPVAMIITSAEGVEGPVVDDLEEWSTNGNEGYVVKPAQTGMHIICVSGEGGTAAIRYCQVPARLPGAHVNVDGSPLTAISPSTTEAAFDCAPGWRNYPASGYSDDYIDEQLFKLQGLVAGKFYRFRTEGAKTNLVMEVYNAAGDILLRNFGTQSGYDCQMTFVPEVSGDYWVGVCEAAFSEDVEDETLEPTYGAVSFLVKTLAAEDEVLDSKDPIDDKYTGATALDPAPGLAGDDVCEKGSMTEEHTLGATDFTDCFRIDATAGLSYKIAAVPCCSMPTDTAPKCVAEVFTLQNGAKVPVEGVAGDINTVLTFDATQDTSYYISLSLENGQGCDFGPYEVFSLMYDRQGRSLGKLNVEIGGATFEDGAVWTIAGYGSYPGGAIKWLPAATYTISFATGLENWTTPANVTAKVEAGKTKVVSVKYSDKFDASNMANDARDGDGSKTGAKVPVIACTPETERVSRSLWANDAADWFKLPVKASGYYTLGFAPEAKTTNVLLRVYRANGTDLVDELEVADGRQGSSTEFFARETADYWVSVTHFPGEVTDAQYVLTHSAVIAGFVQFAQTSYSVKDNAASVSVQAVRVGGSDGIVRARYTTRAYTAKPGENYINASGVLEWEDGDTDAKTITVTLIPDLIAHWQDTRQFQVELAALDPSDVLDGESVPGVGYPGMATVSILEATKKSTGKICFTSFGSSSAPEAFESEARPSVSVSAGDEITLWLERIGGSDGEVAVAVTPVKGTAQPDVNFDGEPMTLVWADGDTAPKAFVLRTLATDEGYQTPKTLSVKIVPDRTYADKSKAGPAVSVTVYDSDFSGGFAEYAAALKADGLSLKGGSSDGWYFDASGLLRSVTPDAGASSTLTLSLSGPGRLSFSPTFTGGDGDVFACTVDGEAIECGDGSSVVKYLGKERHTVAFMVSRAGSALAGEAAYVSFGEQDGGAPFSWKPLESPSLVSPLMNELVIAEETHFVVGGSEDDVYYRLYIDEDKDRIGTAEAHISSLDPAMELYENCTLAALMSFCPGCSLQGLPEGKQYFWRVDSVMLDDAGNVALVNTNSLVWTFRTAEAGVSAVTRVSGGTDASGRAISMFEIPAFGEMKEIPLYPVELRQGVSAEIPLSNTASATARYQLVNGSRLPPGMKLNAAKGIISGVPTSSGEFSAAVMAEGASSVGFKFSVSPIGLLAGTFNGLVESDDLRLSETEDALVPADVSKSIGSLKVTAGENGKLTARVLVGGNTYMFTKSGYDGMAPITDNGIPAATAEFSKAVKVTVNGTRHTCTNTLVITACAGATNDWAALDTPMKVSMVLNTVSADKTRALTNVVYFGEAVRKNAKLPDTKAEFAAFSGYYTVSLPPIDAFDGIPQGNGYITMTITEAGKAKVAAVLADGSTFTCSANISFTSDSDIGLREVRFPVYNAKGKEVFGGWIHVKLNADDVPVVRSDSDLVWANGDFKATRDGEEGYLITVEPTGGWYDTVMNLQAYYIESPLCVAGVDSWMLPEELLSDLDEYVVFPGVKEEYLGIAGNVVAAPAQSLVASSETEGAIDVEKSTNPSNLKFSLKRATGVFSGSFELWAADYASAAVKIGTYSHKGVVLFSWDDEATVLPMRSIRGDTVASGFCTLPIKLGSGSSARTWKCSLPFTVESVDTIIDYNEELPTGVNEGEDDE